MATLAYALGAICFVLNERLRLRGAAEKRFPRASDFAGVWNLVERRIPKQSDDAS